jgi:4-hydroxy-2-oxoheptanedioate aldolase
MTVIDNRLPGLLRGDRPLFGIFAGIPSPALIEMCGHAGFDFVIIDNEHGPAGIETTEHLIRAARCAGIIPVVRTLESEILKVLDIGASAIQVPQVNTAEQASRIVAAAKYPPLGRRGVAFSTRASGYGFFGGADFCRASNDGTSVIVMVESPEAISNLDRIVAVPGIDAIFIGPNDLSFAMGYQGDQKHPEVVATIDATIARLVKAGMPTGLMTVLPDDFRKYASIGARYMTTVFSAVLAGAMRSAVAAVR